MQTDSASQSASASASPTRNRVKITLRSLFVAVIGLFLLNVLLIYHSFQQNYYRRTTDDEQQGGQEEKEADISQQICDLSSNLEAYRALSRVKTQFCRLELRNIACQLRKADFYRRFLNSACPLDEPLKRGDYVGCYSDSSNSRLLNATAFKLVNNSPLECVYQCLRVGAQLAGVEFTSECFCGNFRLFEQKKPVKLSDKLCKKYACPEKSDAKCGGYNAVAVFHTGLAEKPSPPVHYPDAEDIPKNELERSYMPKIAFLLQLNGRDVRQVKRLLKLLYHPRHFYYVHVDKRQDYMHREMLKLEDLLKEQGNFLVKRKRFSPIWGGASLLDMILDSVTDLLNVKMPQNWDFVLNLSETDFPVMPLVDLEALLNKYRGKNFLRSVSGNTKRFIEKQGLNKLFVECENRMWRLGLRPELPKDMRISGGSDWIVLSREFANYSAVGKDEILVELRRIFQHALLPAESFFHTLAMNTRFCTSVVNSHLRLINWKRKHGCKCQYKHIVDWCGCSPNVVKTSDFSRLSATNNRLKGVIFARKFEPVVDQRVIGLAEAQFEKMLLYVQAKNIPPKNLTEAVWLNDFHFEDNYPKQSVAKMAFFRSLIEQFFTGEKQRLHCLKSCKLGTIKELNVLKNPQYFNDDNVNLLLKFQMECRAGTTTDAEILIRKKKELNIVQDQPEVQGNIEFKLTSIDVGLKFDLKEKIFRNYDGIIDPESHPTVRLAYDFKDKGHFHNNNEKNVTFASVTVAWYDSNLAPKLALVERLKDLHISPICHSTLNLNETDRLEAGVWTVALFSENAVFLGNATFPVFPMDNFDLTNQLTSRFYTVIDACLGANSNECSSSDWPQCRRTRWSSLSSDPTSEILSGWSVQLKSLF